MFGGLACEVRKCEKMYDSRDFRTFCFNFVFHHNKLSLAHSLLALIMIKFRTGAMQAKCHACGGGEMFIG